MWQRLLWLKLSISKLRANGFQRKMTVLIERCFKCYNTSTSLFATKVDGFLKKDCIINLWLYFFCSYVAVLTNFMIFLSFLDLVCIRQWLLWSDSVRTLVHRLVQCGECLETCASIETTLLLYLCPLFDTERISCGASSLIPLLRDYVISILKKFSFIYDPLSSPYSLCALNYVLNAKEQQLRLPQRV